MKETLNTYDQRNMDTMELVYGKGFMSPGGAAEVRAIVTGLELENCQILDLGCGTGGACIEIANIAPGARITGVDIEASVLTRAGALIDRAQLGQQIELLEVEPGPLPFDAGRFDCVYANSVTCHFDDLAGLFTDVHRVLKAGGRFIGSEWFVDSNEQAFRHWDELLRGRGLNFYFVALESFERSLRGAGFDDIRFRNRREIIAAIAEDALRRVGNELEPQLNRYLGEDGYAAFLQWTRSRAAVLNGCGMSHQHFFARKPNSVSPRGC